MQAPLVEYETQRLALREDFPAEADERDDGEHVRAPFEKPTAHRRKVQGLNEEGRRCGKQTRQGTSHEEMRTPVDGVNRSGPLASIRIRRSRKDRTQNQSATASIPA